MQQKKKKSIIHKTTLNIAYRKRPTCHHVANMKAFLQIKTKKQQQETLADKQNKKKEMTKQ